MPTIKQKLAATKLSETIRKSNGNGHISLAQVLKDAGYADSVTRKPRLVTQSKGWQELIKDILPDDILLAKLNDLITMPVDVSLIRQGKEVIIKEELNSSTSARALDTAFKLKGRFSKKSLPLNWDEEENKYYKLLPNELTKLICGLYELTDTGEVKLISLSHPNLNSCIFAYHRLMDVFEEIKAEVETSELFPEIKRLYNDHHPHNHTSSSIR